jgi:hypothetical protein
MTHTLYLNEYPIHGCPDVNAQTAHRAVMPEPPNMIAQIMDITASYPNSQMITLFQRSIKDPRLRRLNNSTEVT